MCFNFVNQPFGNEFGFRTLIYDRIWRLATSYQETVIVMTHNSNEIDTSEKWRWRWGRTQPAVVIWTGTSSVSRGYLLGGNDEQDTVCGTPHLTVTCGSRNGVTEASLQISWGNALISLVSLTAVTFFTSRSHQRYTTTDCIQGIPNNLSSVMGTSETIRY